MDEGAAFEMWYLITIPYIYIPLHPGVMHRRRQVSGRSLLATCKNAAKVHLAFATLRPFGRF